MAKTIIIQNPGKLPTMPFNKLRKSFEANTLKDKHNRDVGALKASILQDGMIMPFVVWMEGKYITDGAGRRKVLEMLEYEGYQIPDVPYIPIKAKNKKDAKKQTLLISSKYGQITEESVGDFLLDMDSVDLANINIGLNLEEIDLSPQQPKKKEPKKKDKGKTVMVHTCPKCGHEFN